MNTASAGRLLLQAGRRNVIVGCNAVSGGDVLFCPAADRMMRDGGAQEWTDLGPDAGQLYKSPQTHKDTTIPTTEWWGAGMVICLERGADLHMAQLMPLPLTISCFIKIQIGFTFLVPAHPGSPGQRAVKRVCSTYLPQTQDCLAVMGTN